MDYQPLIEQFYREFPETRKRVLFLSTPETLPENAFSLFNEAMGNSIAAKEGQFEISLVPMKSFMGLLDIRNGELDHGLMQSLNLNSDIATEFAFFHETGHALATIRKLVDETDDVFRRKNLEENFCDAYAALRIMQKHGTHGMRFVKAWSDLRQLFRGHVDLHQDDLLGNSIHDTTFTLDAIYERAARIGMDSVRDLPSAACVYLAANLAKEHYLSAQEQHESLDSIARLVRTDTDDASKYSQRFREAVQRRLRATSSTVTGPWSNNEAAIFREVTATESNYKFLSEEDLKRFEQVMETYGLASPAEREKMARTMDRNLHAQLELIRGAAGEEDEFKKVCAEPLMRQILISKWYMQDTMQTTKHVEIALRALEMSFPKM